MCTNNFPNNCLWWKLLDGAALWQHNASEMFKLKASSIYTQLQAASFDFLLSFIPLLYCISFDSDYLTDSSNWSLAERDAGRMFISANKQTKQKNENKIEIKSIWLHSNIWRLYWYGKYVFRSNTAGVCCSVTQLMHLLDMMSVFKWHSKIVQCSWTVDLPLFTQYRLSKLNEHFKWCARGKYPVGNWIIINVKYVCTDWECSKKCTCIYSSFTFPFGHTNKAYIHTHIMISLSKMVEKARNRTNRNEKSTCLCTADCKGDATSHLSKVL